MKNRKCSNFKVNLNRPYLKYFTTRDRAIVLKHVTVSYIYEVRFYKTCKYMIHYSSSRLIENKINIAEEQGKTDAIFKRSELVEKLTEYNKTAYI